jgi:serine/threonine protein kinase
MSRGIMAATSLAPSYGLSWTIATEAALGPWYNPRPLSTMGPNIQMEAGRFEERYIAIIMREVLLALAYVHKCGIIHRDIKGTWPSLHH